ncbi:MAG: DNA repair protein RecO [Thiolinea sp.]
MTPTFILRRNAFRDNSLLLDLLTLNEGRISAVIRYSKKHASRIRGMLEPFRLLEASWSGRGEVFTLTHAEEKRRFPLKQEALLQATYLNELLLRSFQPHQPIPELFAHYQALLQHLLAGADMQAIMRFELELLATCGYELNLWQDDHSGEDITAQMRYRFRPEQGLQACQTQALSSDDTVISGHLLLALRTPEQLSAEQARELRRVLDRLLRLLLKGKILYARPLLSE